MYDLAQYLFGEPQHQHELRNTWAGSTERVQTQRDGRRLRIVKNSHWEAMYDDGRYLCREVDTSPGHSECYELNDADRATGSVWARKFMAVGQVFQRAPKVTFRHLDNGQPITWKGAYTHVTHLKVEAHHTTWRAAGGIPVDDVLEIVVFEDSGGKPGNEMERYWYGRGKGLVGWRGSIGRSYITKVFAPGDMPDLSPETLNWWKPPEPPPVIEVSPVEGERGAPHYGVLRTTAGVYLRASRKASGATNALGLVPNGQPLTYYPDTQRNENGYDWLWVEAGQASGWMGRVWPTWAEQFSVTPPHTPGKKLEPPLVLGNPLSVPWRISDPFDAPRAYSKYPGKHQRHEGLDFVPASATTAPVDVLAMQTGVVESSGYDAEGYGHWIRVTTDWHGQTIKIWYCHLAAASPLKKGDRVSIGATVGQMGSTGFSSGPHAHITIQWIGSGLSGYVVDDVIDFTSMLPGMTTLPHPALPDNPPIVVPPAVPDALYVPLTVDELRQAQVYHEAIAAQQQTAAEALLEGAEKHRELASMYEKALARGSAA